MSLIHIHGTAESTLSEIHPDGFQPNAYDLRIDKVFGFDADGPAMVLHEGYRVHRKTTDILLLEDDDGEYWVLPEGDYDCLAVEKVNIAENEAGWVITRSTLNRNGITIHSGLYDSGYDGPCGFLMRVRGGTLKLYRHSRVAQLVLADAESSSSYDGVYNQNFNRYS